MDEKIERNLHTIKYTTLIFVTIYIVLNNIRDPWKLLLLSGVFIFSVTLRSSIVYGSDKYRSIGKVLILFDLFVIFLIEILDKSGVAYIYNFILIGDVTIAYYKSFSFLFSIFSFILFLVSDYINNPSVNLISFLSGKFIYLLSFLLIPAIMSIIMVQIGQKELLDKTMSQLKIKARELENVNAKLKEANEELEEITILKERNRIAREIHDTVGHTLTSVILQLEAGEKLISLSPQEAIEKINSAKTQVRYGLNNIRESVKTLKSGNEIVGFIPSIKLLIEEITKNGDIFIRYEISELPDLSPKIEKVFFRALQEGLTNGIKHGRSTAFVFKLKMENNYIKFFLQDNGEGTDKIVKGFGLLAMEERINEIGGTLKIYSKKGDGFLIQISLSIGKDDFSNAGKSNDC